VVWVADIVSWQRSVGNKSYFEKGEIQMTFSAKGLADKDNYNVI